MTMLPEFLGYSFMQRALLVGIVTAMICPAIGVFLVPRRLSLITDTLAHMALAGVALGLVLGVPPVVGALVVTTAGAVGIERLRTRGALAGDASLAVFLSGGLAVAVVLIGVAGGFNVDLFALLFGSILTVSPTDVALILVLGTFVAAALSSRYAALVAATVNEDLARTSGVPVARLNLMVAILTAFTTIVAMRMVGVLLVSAMIVLPTLVGFTLAGSFRGSLRIAIGVAVTAVVIGLMTAYYFRLAAGASIVLVTLFLFGLARIIAGVRHRPRSTAGVTAAAVLAALTLAGPRVASAQSHVVVDAGSRPQSTRCADPFDESLSSWVGADSERAEAEPKRRRTDHATVSRSSPCAAWFGASAVFSIDRDRSDGRSGRTRPTPWTLDAPETRAPGEGRRPDGPEHRSGLDRLAWATHGTHVHSQ
jgi:zinc transport system permease protein